MINTTDNDNPPVLPGFEDTATQEANANGSPTKRKAGTESELPPNLGKAWTDCKVPDFSDPNRKLTCLEQDFPIAQINALSQLEGNAGKPIYQMSKWWARRRSSVFRSMLIAAGTECPDDPSEAAKTVWEHYYCNHQKAGAFKNLKVLEPFMGGGTTLVEGSRLGMKMTGIDLNPVAWFVVKNELACSDPEQVKLLFAEIEQQVKPQIQPFYTTTCPRGHKGRWIDIRSNQPTNVDPIDLAPEERVHYRWEGPEIIYTFWAKHGPCSGQGCNHRTPIFKSAVIAEKVMTVNYLELTCPNCGEKFHAELGETTMAPGVIQDCTHYEPMFNVTSQEFASLLNDYDKGSAQETIERMWKLDAMLDNEKGLCCPECNNYAGKAVGDVLANHKRPACRSVERKKKAFKIQKKKVHLWLCIHPNWLEGIPGIENSVELGGYAGAPAELTAKWNERRLHNLELVEIRADSLPQKVDGYVDLYPEEGTVPRQAHFTCGHCGKENNTLEAVRPTGHTAPVAAYAFQCHCPQCEAEGYNYNGRYFKAPDAYDIRRLNQAEFEWPKRSENDLSEFWPREICWDAYMMRANGGVNEGWGYTNWWKMFNSRQLLVHTQLLKSIMNAAQNWPLDVCEQVLGGFQQYLRNQNMFCFYQALRDHIIPHMSNNNYHPKALPAENNVFSSLGQGNWSSSAQKIIDGAKWALCSWESLLTEDKNAKSIQVVCGDSIISGNIPRCGSSTDMSMLGSEQFDLVITDPPFGNNLFYADLADFFYVWLRIPLKKWYAGTPEEQYFLPERTPHSTEAVDNSVEHPDDRESYEKEPFISETNLGSIKGISGDETLEANDPNPLYRPEPASEFYSQTLSACWAEAGARLKDGGIMAFTFHHNDDGAWIDVLKALFDAGYYLIATYPIRSDETRGDNAAFGSKKIEYDVIHVCRKMLKEPEPVSWSKMRRWVKGETSRLKALLESTHGKALPQADLRVILRGKSLEFYSQHYGQVYTGEGQVLGVRDALLGINQLLDDLLEDAAASGGLRPPDSVEPITLLYLRMFKNVSGMARDVMHKTLQGSGISQNDLESRGWIAVNGRNVRAVTIQERHAALTRPGRNRKLIKSDLDQAFFLMGCILTGKQLMPELENPALKLKKAVPDILTWYRDTANDPHIQHAASAVLTLMAQHRQALAAILSKEPLQLSLFDELEGENE